MRTKLNLRPVYLAGAFLIAIPASAVALTRGSLAQSAPQLTVAPQDIRYGDEVTVSGTTSSADSGEQLVLAYQQPGTQWRPIASTNVQSDGSFRFTTRLWRSGLLNVLPAEGPTTTTVAAAIGAAGQPAAPSGISGTPPAGATPQSVAVGAKLVLRNAPINVLSGRTVDLRGRLLPGLAGRTVQLDGRSGGSWRRLATVRTTASGRFDLRFPAGGLGAKRLRVLFAGDATNGPSTARPALLTVYRPSGASWYDDSGATACGFHAAMGVANRTLPCGTHVTFAYAGHRVTAVVDDRGPFVGGRDWDLNQNTAAALGFAGADALWSSK